MFAKSTAVLLCAISKWIIIASKPNHRNYFTASFPKTTAALTFNLSDCVEHSSHQNHQHKSTHRLLEVNPFFVQPDSVCFSVNTLPHTQTQTHIIYTKTRPHLGVSSLHDRTFTYAFVCLCVCCVLLSGVRRTQNVDDKVPAIVWHFVLK